MCGIVGLVHPRSGHLWDPHVALQAMMDSLAHRGPDDSGVQVEEQAGLFMGFRRLSILDLSSAGHQPMVSASGRYVLTFNGEVYNFASLRDELEGQRFLFKGRSDTEVVLAAVERWGCESAARRLRGMFALSVWDRDERHLWLARDRMGIKPLYLLQANGGLAYSSEARAFHHCPLFAGRGNPAAARRYLQKLYVPGSESILEGVERVAPGQLIKFRLGYKGVEELERIRFWHLPDVASTGASKLINDEEEVVDGLVELMRESIRLHLVADVPVGAFLSGGVDSSVVVALMQELSDTAVRTFTIRFDDPQFDEGEAAARVADHLGTKHTAVSFSTDEVVESIPLLPGLSDEPMANPSLLPTLLVSRVARRDVVVALSGDGGDELFGGYNRYAYGARLIRATQRVPAPIRGLAARAVSAAGRTRLAARAFEMLRPDSVAVQQSPTERLLKVAGVLRGRSASEAYDNLLSVGLANPPLARGQPTFRDSESPDEVGEFPRDLEARMMLSDQMHYLPDDLLAKVDRASMWQSLEARVPILDDEVVAYSWCIPSHIKIRRGVTKWPLRQIALNYLPAALLERPKMGFTVPIASWLQGPLHDWARDAVSEASVRRVGLLDGSRVNALWAAFEAGRADLALPLWSASVLHAWCDTWDIGFSG